jgi:signal transduction histidine kinase
MFDIHCTAHRRLVRWLMIVAMTAGSASAISSGAERLPKSVLFLELSNQTRVWNFALSNAFYSIINTNPARRIYSETLDINRFGGPRYEEILRNYLRDKYRGIPIGVIVVPGLRSLDFFLSLDLWSGVPVVVTAIDEVTSATRSLPPNVTGRIMRLSLRDMVSTARTVVPGLKRIAVVGDPFERSRFQAFKSELPELSAALEFIDLTGLPMAELRKRVATLPEDAAIVYTGMTVDGSGMDYVPRDALAIIAEVANRPIVGESETYIGYGVVGGTVLDPIPVGQEAGRLALRILDGESVSNLPVAEGDFTRPIFDWRQLKRWQVSEATLPEGSEVRFREASAWEQYHTQILIVLAAMLLQSVIISGLLLERRRRRAAELESRGRLAQVMHMNRSAGLSAISSALAHELNQPLGAILSNAEAAEILLKKDPPDLNLIGAILADIRKSDQRAGEVITHLRDLLRNNDRDQEIVNLNDVIMLALEILNPEANARGVTLTANFDPHPLPVRANPVHLQQVLLNLVLNGMDATASRTPGDRQVIVRTALVNNATIKVSIADSGSGIPADKLQQIFEPFFTTKEKGTGLGLPIARTILERSGGEISAENRPHGGAVFRFSLPLVRELVA